MPMPGQIAVQNYKTRRRPPNIKFNHQLSRATQSISEPFKLNRPRVHDVTNMSNFLFAMTSALRSHQCQGCGSQRSQPKADVTFHSRRLPCGAKELTTHCEAHNTQLLNANTELGHTITEQTGRPYTGVDRPSENMVYIRPKVRKVGDHTNK